MSASTLIPEKFPENGGEVTITLVDSGTELAGHYTWEEYNIVASAYEGYRVERLEYTYSEEDLWNGGITTYSEEIAGAPTQQKQFTFTEQQNKDDVYHYGNYTLLSVTAYFIKLSLITVIADPTEGGTVSGGGYFLNGSSCTVYASANRRYTFEGWYEDSTLVSSSQSYTFTVSGDRILTARFSSTTTNYTISVSADPDEGGSVSGGGVYTANSTCTVTAFANSGYLFIGWYENNIQVTTVADYSFVVTQNRTLVARFYKHTDLLINTYDKLMPVTLVYYEGSGLLVADY